MFNERLLWESRDRTFVATCLVYFCDSSIFPRLIFATNFPQFEWTWLIKLVARNNNEKRRKIDFVVQYSFSVPLHCFNFPGWKTQVLLLKIQFSLNKRKRALRENIKFAEIFFNDFFIHSFSFFFVPLLLFFFHACSLSQKSLKQRQKSEDCLRKSSYGSSKLKRFFLCYIFRVFIVFILLLFAWEHSAHFASCFALSRARINERNSKNIHKKTE